MAVALRLSRGGSKKRPFFRIVAADVRSPRDGKFIERLGTYNPMKSKDDPERILIKKERISYWLSVGAKPTDRVAKFLANEGMVDKPKVYPQTKKNKPKAKTLEKLKAKEEKVKNKTIETEDTTQNKPEAENQIKAEPTEPSSEAKTPEVNPTEPLSEAKTPEVNPTEPSSEAKTPEVNPTEPLSEVKTPDAKNS